MTIFPTSVYYQLLSAYNLGKTKAYEDLEDGVRWIKLVGNDQ